MGFTRLTPTYQPHGKGLCSLNAHHAALSSAVYTICSSLLVVAIYCWRVVVSAYDPYHLQDVYYGVQISYISTIVTHITLVALSSSLLVGVCQERIGLVAPWVVANIAFMALEAVCCMYSNVLRDHINKRFDGICKAEMIFFSTRVFINIFCLWSVMRFLRNIRAGITYKEPEAIEL
ncbi:uncharacterized protein [Macrobrachium rosenbergii]|uniref:uncharacterized protein n=1 Tax=Macrobrachium rosenbergii TaxID=79674 RepID=UPI0034D59F71